MTPPKITGIRTTESRLIVELGEGREMSLALSISERLARATPDERMRWTIGTQGLSVHWPAIDEDIAVWDVLGIDEDAYLRSLREAPVG
jgi:hypothetical protein